MRQKDYEITLHSVSLSYGDNVIYDNFNVNFSQGVNVILGKSGCGKTTLLNIIMGLVHFNGKCIAPKPSVVFSEPTLAPVSVENNVRMVLGKNYDKQVDDALAIARIADKRKQNTLTLSDGEKQRVALARAFACKRSVMLLDEPFSRLDCGVKRQLYDTLIDYLQKTNVTVLLVTHDIDEALTLADRIYFLDGRPCDLTEAAKLTEPQINRNIYDEQYGLLRLQLHNLFENSTAKN